MKRVNLNEIEAYDDEKFIRPEVLKGERTRVLLLCLRPGQPVPPHRHEGFEILLSISEILGHVDLLVDDGAVSIDLGAATRYLAT